MAPICLRTFCWICFASSAEGMGEVGCGLVESVMNAKGKWPLRASGMGMTQHSAIEEWVAMACSMAPVYSQRIIPSTTDVVAMIERNGEGVILTSTESMCSNIDDIIRSRHDMHIAIIINHPRITSVNPLAVKPL